jgi:hypothetical protein
MGDEPLKVVTHMSPADVANAFEEPPLVVHTPFTQADVGEAPEPPIVLPMQEPASYTIRTSPPDGAVEAFSGDGQHTADRYDNAVFFLAPDGRGTFTFRGHQGFPVEGTGTVTAQEVRTEFEAPNRDIRGVFKFPRGGQIGQVTLTNGSEHLIARATVGVSI